jgi:hypothetical protein
VKSSERDLKSQGDRARGPNPGDFDETKPYCKWFARGTDELLAQHEWPGWQGRSRSAHSARSFAVALRSMRYGAFSSVRVTI